MSQKVFYSDLVVVAVLYDRIEKTVAEYSGGAEHSVLYAEKPSVLEDHDARSCNQL